VATTYCVFASRRAHDFISIQCALTPRNVKIVAGLPGLTTAYGGTHQGIDDLALMRAIPGMLVLDPADATEIALATQLMIAHEGPAYMRLQRGEVPVVFDENSHRVEIGRARVVREGDDVVIVACGVMVQRALQAAHTLAGEGIEATVVSSPSLKPFDDTTVVELGARCGALVTAENHTVIGGLYSCVAEALVRHGTRAAVEPVAIADEYCGFGSPAYLAERHGLAAHHIATAARTAMQRRDA
jgi:transketolase